MQTAVFLPHVQGGNRHIEITRQKFEHFAPQRLQRVLTQGVLGQLPLPGAQPQLLLQQQGGSRLLVFRQCVRVRQALQLAAPQHRQQPAQSQAEEQVGGHAPCRVAAGQRVAFLEQAFFNVDEVRELLPDFIGQTFATGRPHGRLVVQVLAPQVNDVLCKLIPLGLQGSDAAQACHLRLVVLNQIRQ